MNAPSPSIDAALPPHQSTSARTDIGSPPPLRRLPLVPVGGWRWIGIKRDPHEQHIVPSEKTKPILKLARPRRMKLCARTVLLWGLLWYALVQLFPLFLKDRWQLIETASESRKFPALRRLVDADPKSPLLLMTGSSRTCWAFRAAALDGMLDSDGRPWRVFNFGIPATGPISQLHYLRDFLAEGIRPRFLLIEVNPPLMGEQRRGALTEEGFAGFEWFTIHRMRQWWPYMRRPQRRLRAWLEARFAPCYAFRRQIHTEVKLLADGKTLPKYEPVDDWGWHLPTMAFLPDGERNRRVKLAHEGYSPGISRFQLGKKPSKALHEILDICRRENIPAALVVMPESSAFRSWYCPEARTAIRGLLDELSRDYGVEVIDANCWVADDDFEDGHHVLPHGADVFTYLLHAELPRLLARSKAVKSD